MSQQGADGAASVCVPDFYLGKFEVTQGQWKAVMGINPAHFSACGDDCPVEQVSVADIGTFLERLSERTGKRYRLPTESEWEYAARSGGKSESWAGTSNPEELSNCAWYGGNAGGMTHPVGRKKPNGLGLYDMSGNVWEWVVNRPAGGAMNASVMSGGVGTLRGGSWQDDAEDLRVSKPGWVEPILRTSMVGFRVALTPESMSEK